MYCGTGSLIVISCTVAGNEPSKAYRSVVPGVRLMPPDLHRPLNTRNFIERGGETAEFVLWISWSRSSLLDLWGIDINDVELVVNCED